MPDKEHSTDAARTVRDQLEEADFGRALRTGHPILSNEERFRRLLDRLDESEKKQK